MGIHGAFRQLPEQAAATANLIEHLKSLGQSDESAIDISIESETNLKEIVEKLLAHQMEVTADIAKMDLMLKAIAERKRSYAAQNETIRSLLAAAFDQASLKNLKTAFGTVSLKDMPPEVEVLDDSEIPTRFFKVPDPVIDRASLRAEALERFKARTVAIYDAMLLINLEERTRALKAVERDLPLIDGVKITTGRKTISIRR